MWANTGYVMTLANSIIGVGILAMPFCFQKCGILLAIFLLFLSNWITRICCHYLIKSSLLTRRKSFEFLGFHAFGSSGKLLVELCIIGYLLGTCITYFVVVGDLGPQIVTKMFALPQDTHHLRTWLMSAVTVFCILPLAMLKNVDSLSVVCTASIGFYVCLVVKIILESQTHITAHDWQDVVAYWQPNGILQCLPIFSMALSCQMQIFEVFSSINNQSLEKLNGIVRNATWICTLVYIAMGFFGYVAFCTQTFAGNILMNLTPSFGSDVIKIGFVLSVAFSFPLVIFPCRASLYSLLYRKGQADATGYIPESRFKVITLFIVVFSLSVALMIPSVELIIGLVGSTIGVAICVMFPAACFRQIVKKNSTERSLAQLIVVGGFCLMILGTYANLSAIDAKSSGAHLDKSMNQDSAEMAVATELPKDLLKQEIQHFEKVLVEKLTKQEAQEKEEEKEVLLETINETKVVIEKKAVAPPPTLPIEEKHNEDAVKIENIQEKREEQEAKPLQPSTSLEQKDKLNSVNQEPNSIKKAISANSSSLEKPRVIDNEAFKKEDEEIINGEVKQKETDYKDNEELQKTQKELKKTKDLLEKRVEELKEELAKQNQETQNLVEEKLGKVVEKFEQIERKVEQQQQQQEIQQQQQKAKENINNTESKVMAKLQPSVKKDTLLNKLKPPSHSSEMSNVELKYNSDAKENNEIVNNKNGMEPPKPLPLAVLINNTHTAIKVNNSQNYIPPPPPPPSSQHINHAQDNTNKPAKLIPQTYAANNTLDKEHVDSIRRDILQVKSDHPTEATTISWHEEWKENTSHRIKRSPSDSENIEDIHENCSIPPKIDNYPPNVETDDVHIKTGRDLKSIKGPLYS